MRSGGDQWGFLSRYQERLEPSRSGDFISTGCIETRRVLILYRVLKNMGKSCRNLHTNRRVLILYRGLKRSKIYGYKVEINPPSAKGDYTIGYGDRLPIKSMGVEH